MSLAVLQSVRLKGGMASTTVIGRLTGLSDDEAQAALNTLAVAEQVVEHRGRYRITPVGREALSKALTAERGNLDKSALAAIWDEFEIHDKVLKQICQDWQLRDGEPNDHFDDAYDNAVIQRLAELHAQVGPLAVRIASVCPRLSRYPARLDFSLQQISTGNSKFIANPMVDSYHQVFHELHEELYDATGKNRATTEVAAG
ncbi:hypothetical protein CF98_17595 [Halopseudomonas bauzanensis]|nr:hypothetical protein CF98_17595 [Halopseudomonas bauzanensis]